MRYKLKEIFDLQMGKTPSRKNLDYWNTKDYKWISIADLSQTRKYISDTKEYLSCSAVEESGIKVIPANTVVMSFKLSIGKTAITSEDMYSNEAIMAFRDKHVVELLPEYIYYMFKCKNWDEGSNKAVMGKTLNKATLSEVEIDICPVVGQREIVNVLDKIMRIMSDRREEIKLLDDLIKSRFIEMFGDPEQNPNGYPIKDFDEISVLVTDGEHATPHRTEKGIYLLSARNILNHALQLDDVDYIDEDEYARIAQRVVPQAGDVLISCSGSIGRCCVVPDGLQFQMVRSVALIRFDNTINPIFAEWLITSDELQRQIALSATQSSQANLFQGKIRKLHGYVPPMEFQQEFVAFVEQTNKSKLLYRFWGNSLSQKVK